MKSYDVTIQIKRLWQNVGVVLVISLDFPKSNINILVNFFFGSTIMCDRVKTYYAETNGTKISPYGGMDVRYGIG